MNKIFFFIGISILFIPSSVFGACVDTDYSKSYLATISNPSSWDKVLEPVTVIFEHDGNMRSDCNDIRVYENNTNLLEIWTNSTLNNYYEGAGIGTSQIWGRAMICNSTHAEVSFRVNMTANQQRLNYTICFDYDSATPPNKPNWWATHLWNQTNPYGIRNGTATYTGQYYIQGFIGDSELWINQTNSGSPPYGAILTPNVSGSVNNFSLYVTNMVTGGGSGNAGVMIGVYVNATDYIWLEGHSSGSGRIISVVAGGVAVPYGASTTFVAGDMPRIARVGNDFYFYKNPTTLLYKWTRTGWSENIQFYYGVYDGSGYEGRMKVDWITINGNWTSEESSNAQGTIILTLEEGGEENPCEYSGDGDFIIDCGECNGYLLTTPFDIGDNKLILMGNGIYIMQTTLENVKRIEASKECDLRISKEEGSI